MNKFLLGGAFACALGVAFVPARNTHRAGLPNGPSVNGSVANGVETGASGLTTTSVKADSGKLYIR